MTKTDWLMKFRRCQTLATLETVYEYLSYKIGEDEVYTMTQAYDHRKPAHIWKFV
jgi:hemolysin expression modulating protein